MVPPIAAFLTTRSTPSMLKRSVSVDASMAGKVWSSLFPCPAAAVDPENEIWKGRLWRMESKILREVCWRFGGTVRMNFCLGSSL